MKARSEKESIKLLWPRARPCRISFPNRKITGLIGSTGATGVSKHVYSVSFVETPSVSDLRRLFVFPSLAIHPCGICCTPIHLPHPMLGPPCPGFKGNGDDRVSPEPAHNPKVAGSNPAPATSLFNGLGDFA